MLQIQHLTMTHRRDQRVLLNDFTFALQPGDRAALIGEEGNGKSTLLRLLYREELVRDYIEYTGAILKNGENPGYLPQELTGEQKSTPVSAFCAAAPAFYDYPPRELAALAARRGLDPAIWYDERPVGSLSGGEKIRLQLALLDVERPTLLLLDEPSNDLDGSALTVLEEYLLTSPVPVLYVSHDETLLSHTANVILHLEQIRRKTEPRYTVARRSYDDYVSARRARLEHQTRMAEQEQRDHEKQVEKYRRIYQRVDHEQAVISRADPGGGRLLKKKMKSVLSQGKRMEREYEGRTRIPEVEEAIAAGFPPRISLPAGKVVLDIRQPVLYAGERELVRDWRLRVTGGEKVGITGANGAGKTTLLRRIASLLLPRGDIRAGYMPQDYGELVDTALTPVEFLAGCLERRESREETEHQRKTRIRTFLGSFRYTPEEMDHPAGDLSGGQKAKLLLIRLILEEDNVLLLDEPTRNFSPLSQPVVRSVLRDFGGSIISVSHDRRYLAEVCDTVYRLVPQGLIREEKDPR